jgi:hypothetical protein
MGISLAPVLGGRSDREVEGNGWELGGSPAEESGARRLIHQVFGFESYGSHVPSCPQGLTWLLHGRQARRGVRRRSGTARIRADGLRRGSTPRSPQCVVLALGIPGAYPGRVYAAEVQVSRVTARLGRPGLWGSGRPYGGTEPHNTQTKRGNVVRSEALDQLAYGSSCPRCGADPDESCRTPYGRRGGGRNPTLPHGSRIDRAVRQYQAARAAMGEKP